MSKRIYNVYMSRCYVSQVKNTEGGTIFMSDLGGDSRFFNTESDARNHFNKELLRLGDDLTVLKVIEINLETLEDLDLLYFEGTLSDLEKWIRSR